MRLPWRSPRTTSAPCWRRAWRTCRSAPIVDEAHDLDSFYARVSPVSVRGKAKDHVRIAVYGDSNMTMDFITGSMRRLLQGKYGDGGHGYVAMGRP